MENRSGDREDMCSEPSVLVIANVINRSRNHPLAPFPKTEVRQYDSCKLRSCNVQCDSLAADESCYLALHYSVDRPSPLSVEPAPSVV